MGGRNSRNIRPPRRQRTRSRGLVGPADIFRILIEELIRKAIEQEIDRRRNQAPLLIGTQTRQAQLPRVNYMRLSADIDQKEEVEAFDTEALLKSLNEIPPEYVDQLQDPEAVIKHLNIDVPPEQMPKVTAALAKLYHQRHQIRMSP